MNYNFIWSFYLYLVKILKIKKIFLYIILSILVVNSFSNINSWEKMYDGVYLGDFTYNTADGDISLIVVKVNIDSNKIAFLSETDNKKYDKKGTKAWAKKENLLVAINACMFSKDHLTPTGYTKANGKYYNKSINSRYGAFLVFDPINNSYPSVRIIDSREEANWRTELKKYSSFIQNYRLIDLNGKNVWREEGAKYPAAAIGIDKSGNLLLIYTSTLCRAHEFGNAIINLPLDIKNAMYVEGGQTASMYIQKSAINSIELIGRYRFEASSKRLPGVISALPNIIGIKKKSK